MEQFNLQAYLKNPDRKIVTRNGCKVRIICTDRYPDNYPIVALLQGPTCENTWCYRKDGLWLEGAKTPRDLFFAPEKKEGWINIYHYDGIENANAARRIYDTKEEALSCKNKGYVDTVKIEWEE